MDKADQEAEEELFVVVVVRGILILNRLHPWIVSSHLQAHSNGFEAKACGPWNSDTY